MPIRFFCVILVEMNGYSNSLPYRWLYIDFNSYFASVEQQLNPALRGKPVAVVPVESDSTCAIAASYEAKAFGVKTGTPVYEAKRMCPKLICVLAQHEAYLHFHHRILQEIDKYLPVARVCSIDEVACELMDNENSFEKATEIAKKIKKGLAAHVGEWIKCSIGVAPNRYLAKLATDMQKPDGLTFIHSTELPQKLYGLNLRDLPGIGANMEKRLFRFRIADLPTLCSLDLKQIRKVWGSVLGERMWYYLRGIDLPDLETKRSSIGHSHVLAPELRPPQKARSVAVRLTLKAASRLRRMNYVASFFTLSLRTGKGDQYQASAKCWQASDTPTFLKLLSSLWDQLMKEANHQEIKKVSVTLEELTESSSIHPEFLIESTDLKKRARADRLSGALDQINRRYGRDTILLGILPNEGKSFSGTKIAFTRIPDEEEFLE